MSTGSQSATSSLVQVFLRILTVVASLVATFLMVTSKQSTVVYGIPLQAQYNYSTAFKFFACANGIACGLSLLSLIIAFIACRRGSRVPGLYLTLDLVVMSLVMAGFAAAMAIGYVGKYGENHIGWMPICDNVSQFCNRVTMSAAASFVAFLSLKMLSIMSLLRL